MNLRTPIEDANGLMIRRLVQEYLPSYDGELMTIADACVSIGQIGNRYGIPRDAKTYLVQIDNPYMSFEMSVRSVWRDGDLYRPSATHTVIIDIETEDGLDLDAAHVRVNEWLMTVPLSAVLPPPQ